MTIFMYLFVGFLVCIGLGFAVIKMIKLVSLAMFGLLIFACLAIIALPISYFLKGKK